MTGDKQDPEGTRKSAACGRVCLVGQLCKNLAVRNRENPAGRHPLRTAGTVFKNDISTKKITSTVCNWGTSNQPTFVNPDNIRRLDTIRERETHVPNIGRIHLDLFASLRCRRGDFVPSRWRLPECQRMIFPVAVILKRLAAPRCVLSFFFLFFFTIPSSKKFRMFLNYSGAFCRSYSSDP